jgi:hypothetical protein
LPWEKSFWFSDHFNKKVFHLQLGMSALYEDVSSPNMKKHIKRIAAVIFWA